MLRARSIISWRSQCAGRFPPPQFRVLPLFFTDDSLYIHVTDMVAPHIVLALQSKKNHTISLQDGKAAGGSGLIGRPTLASAPKHDVLLK